MISPNLSGLGRISTISIFSLNNGNYAKNAVNFHVVKLVLYRELDGSSRPNSSVFSKIVGWHYDDSL